MSSTDDKSSSIIAVSATMTSIMVCAIFLRVYTRCYIVKWIGIDDSLIVVAAMFALVENMAPVAATRYGLGKHHTQQKSQWVEPYTKLLLASSLSYSATAMFIKLSLLTFYMRLTLDHAVFKNLVYIMIFVSIGFGVGSIMSAALQCIPISMLWDATVKGKCVNINMFYFANAGLNIITDTVIYCLPIPTLWRLRLPTVQRIGLCAALGLGGLVVVTSIYRITTIRDLLSSPDGTWNVVSPLNWSTIEINLAIFVTCVPSFKAFIRYHSPTLLGSTPDNTYGNFAGRSRYDTRQRSIAMASLAHSERDGSSISQLFHLRGKTTTTISGLKNMPELNKISLRNRLDSEPDITMSQLNNFSFGKNYDSDKLAVLPRQGIVQFTTIRVEHEDAINKSGTSSTGSLDIERCEDQF